MRSKSCLKVSPLPSRSATPDSDATPRKCVTWCSHMLEEVFEADDWDRTPHEPSKHLSYRLLELKSIQRSLPYADQPPDPLTGKPGASRLNKVPLTLLPLLPAESSPPPMSPPPSACSQSPSHMLSPTPTSPPNTRKFNIAFTPLMPSSSPCSENFPHSSPEPSVQHAPIATNPPERKKRVFEINGMEFEMDDDDDSDQSKDVVRPPLTPPSTPQPGHSSLTSPSPQSCNKTEKSHHGERHGD
ncbi:hypothetical protein DL96DRAFT_1459950 [Flagelloscypha sp. PMI_526]|nr:hypothetical protein DL96DRAFT_1459950 [Flagelloscypha sp. PMI_526]